ncbi:MAG: toxin-antitoxin system HicB family antitoxin [Gemmatimonadaceae bacterium]
MSSISLRLPDSLHKQARELAEREDISINQLIATALAEKMAALMTGEYLGARATRGSRKKFEQVLKKVRVRRQPPDSGDEL